MSSEDLNKLNELVTEAAKNIRVFREDTQRLQQEPNLRHKRFLERLDRMENPEKYAGQTAEIINISKFDKSKIYRETKSEYTTPYKISPLPNRAIAALKWLRGLWGVSSSDLKKIHELSHGDIMRLVKDKLIESNGGGISFSQGMAIEVVYRITAFGREVLNDIEEQRK